MKIYQVDSFSRELFKGNPAGVCIVDQEVTVSWMQNVAMEMNLSETAFVFPQEGSFGIRFFSPSSEVDLCGHATLASAHILFEIGRVDLLETVIFESNVGILQAKQDPAGNIDLDFPAYALEPVSKEVIMKVERVLPWKVLDARRTKRDLLVEIDSQEMLEDWVPSFDAITRNFDTGLLITKRSTCREYDFISRCFYPIFGIDEDPVTGSAHCVLGSYWAAKLDKHKLSAYQASPRGGSIMIEVGDKRICIKGKAITFFAGNLI